MWTVLHVKANWKQWPDSSSLSGNCIQRMRRTPPLDELQPPPYQDDSGSPHLSCTPSEIGDSKCEFSHCSNSPRCSYNKCPSEGSTGHEIESFHTKGYEEDVPSDSTAVLSPEVSKSTQNFLMNVIWRRIILCLNSWLGARRGEIEEGEGERKTSFWHC